MSVIGNHKKDRFPACRGVTLPMKFMVLSIMLGVFAICQAKGLRTWHFTGVELVSALEGKMPSPVRDSSLHSFFSTSYGQAYILGIADQTQGSRWCTRTGLLPHELSDRVYTYLLTLPKARLDSNAGALVSEVLQRSFPCLK